MLIFNKKGFTISVVKPFFFLAKLAILGMFLLLIDKRNIQQKPKKCV